MKQPVVISPTITIGEYFCREILSLRARDHVITLNSLDRLGGLDRPTIILYPCPIIRDVWEPLHRVAQLYSMLDACRAMVIYMPEVTRVNRDTVNSDW